MHTIPHRDRQQPLRRLPSPVREYVECFFLFSLLYLAKERMHDPIDSHLQEQGIPFGKYQLVAKLAIGGMAELFVAKQKGMGGFSKTVAVKCILPYFARDQEFITMFLDEARLAAHLNHPNVVQIHDIGDVDGVFYMTMEYIGGQNLKAFAKRLYTQSEYRETPPFGQIASIFVQALQGLEHVHNAKDDNLTPLQMVHRDISPNNLMLSYDGNVKIVDFGVAKAKTQERETQVGVLKGRLSYMSPEHLSGQRLDGRSDIFAIGVVLYELTTNRRLFKRKSEAETMQALMTSPIPPPSRFYEDYPPGLEAVLMKALQRDPEKRYQTAGEMRDALEDWLGSYDGAMLGTRHLIAMMDELFAEEKEMESRGEYAKPVTQNDLMNLARGSYRVMPDGSIHSYFAPPGSVPPPAQPGTRSQYGSPPHMAPLVASATTPRETNSYGGFASADAASPYHSPSSAEHHVVPTEVELAVEDGEPTDVGQQGHSSSRDALPAEARTTSPYAAEQPAAPASMPGISEALAGQVAALPDNPRQTAAFGSPVGSSASLESVGLIREVELEQEEGDGLITDANLSAAPDDDDEPPTSIQALPPGSQEQLAAISQDVLQASLSPPVGMRPVAPALQVEEHKEDRRSRGGLVFVLLFLLVAGGGGGVWWWLQSNDTGGLSSTDGTLASGDAEPVLDAGGQGLSGAPDRPAMLPDHPAGAPDSSEHVGTTAPGWRMQPRRQSVPRRLARVVRPRRIVRRGRDDTSPIVPRTVPRSQRMRRKPYRPSVRPRPRRLRRRVAGRLQPKRSFSSVRLQRKIRLAVYDNRGGQRVYTNAHPRLCRQIEREVGKVFGSMQKVRGITRAWQAYVKKRFARSRRKRYVFYPRAAAYVIYRDLSRGKSRAYVAQNLVKYQKRYRFSRYRNK